MTKTAVEQIMEAIETRLCNIKADWGYSCTVKKVKHTDGEKYEDGDMPYVRYFERDKEITSTAYNESTQELRVAVDIVSKVDPKLPLKTKAARLEADVITALNRAPIAPLVSDDVNLDLGDLVENLSITRVEYQASEGQTPWAAALVDITIIYHSDNSDPYTIKV